MPAAATTYFATTAVQDRVHDLHNLFTVIESSAHLLQDCTLSDRQALLVHAIDRAAQRGDDISGAMLGHHAAPPRGQVDVNSVVADLAPVFTALLGPRIGIALDLCGEPLPVALDAIGLDNALLELVLNARSALGGQGNVLIRSCRVGTRAWIMVADTGCGIARAQWPAARFIPEQRGGLPRIDRWLGSVHGRRHWRSAVGVGTIAALDLPLRITVPAQTHAAAVASTLERNDARRPVAA